MVQWLRVCTLPIQGAWIWSLVKELRSFMPQGTAKDIKKTELSLSSHIIYMTLHKPQFHHLWYGDNISLSGLIYGYLKPLAGEGNGTPLQYSCLENLMDGGAWKAAVHRVVEGRTRLSNFTFTFHFHALEKEMATHSSVLAWRIPGTGEPDGLQSMGSHRVGHDWSDLAAAA